MSTVLVCPQCGEAYSGTDYCPVHWVRLVQPAAADTSPEAAPQTEEGTEKEGDSRLARFMSKLGLRRVADKNSLDSDNATAVTHAEPPSVLPETVREKGWRIAGPVQGSQGAVDHWPVERPTEYGSVVAGQFYRYRTGALTSPEIYRRLEAHTTPLLARVWAHGTVDLGGARADYELVSLPKAGRSLRAWLKESTPSEQRAWHLFPLLVELLRQLATSDVRPLSFEPDWLQYTDDDELWLATAATLTDVTIADAFRAEFERSALLPRGCTAPELTQQNMVSANASLFSLGQVLAEAVWGQPCSIEELQKGAVPFQKIADARLARVLMGCLWPRASERWTVDLLFQAAACDNAEAMPAAPAWASLVPGASSAAFALAGTSFWRLDDLLAEAVKPSRWDEAIARIEAILDWAEGTVWAGQVKLMRKALDAGRSADWVLVALSRAVLPDSPPTWRALDLTDDEAMQSLVGLAQRALKGSPADVAAMRELLRADLRGAFAQAPQKP